MWIQGDESWEHLNVTLLYKTKVMLKQSAGAYDFRTIAKTSLSKNRKCARIAAVIRFVFFSFLVLAFLGFWDRGLFSARIHFSTAGIG
jgi:hypothetical protein